MIKKIKSLFLVDCISCGGDGVETCHNPDHGFLNSVISHYGANESACPVCGHNKEHKIVRYVGNGKYKSSVCYDCKGTGEISVFDFLKKEREYDIEYVDYVVENLFTKYQYNMYLIVKWLKK